jgi:parallel beta-helix repeat protein
MIISITLIIILLSIISGCLQQEKNIIYVGSTNADYSTIQEAINAAKNGATIIIKNGSYNELLVINKTITLIGEDKNTTIINFSPDYDIRSSVSIININADNCSIENLQITLSNKSRFVYSATYEQCCGEPAVTETKVFLAGGISINSNYNTIKNTIITNVSDGIELSANSESNTIIHNEIKNNQIGIETLSSVNNNISHNILSNNQQYNIYLTTDSNTNKVSFNIMDNSIYGIRIKGSQHNNVYKNCIKNNDVGIYCCCDAKSNYIYNNTLLNNSLRNAEENEGLTNIWYDYPNGNGNYWDNYTGSDENHDGIGDIPYEIYNAGNRDIYPLMTPPLDVPCNQ